MHTPGHSDSLQILDHAPMGVIICDREGVITWCNQTLAGWLGGAAQDYRGQRESALLHGSNCAHGIIGNGHFQTRSGHSLQRQQMTLADGQQAICYLDVSAEQALQHEHAVLSRQLEQGDHMQAASGLLSEAAIYKNLGPLISRSRRYHNQLSLISMHITTLAQVEQDYGHHAVEKTVAGIGQLLRDQIRWADMLGRLKSGYFIFILPETDQDAATAMAGKLAGILHQLLINIGENQPIRPKACFGIASWDKGDDSGSLLSRCRQATQSASQLGDFAIEAA